MKKQFLFTLSVLLIVSHTALAQISTPQFPEMGSVLPGPTAVAGPGPMYPASGKSYGNNAAGIIKQQNDLAMQRMGAVRPVAPQPGQVYYDAGVHRQKMKELELLLQEIKNNDEFRGRKNTSYYNTPEYALQTKPYQDALKQLTGMLNGSRKLSIAEAYFLNEQAYGNTYLNRGEYYSILNRSAVFIKTWMQEQGYDRTDNEALNTGIQKFMSETLSITENKDRGDKGASLQTISHRPFFYDYEDFQGEQDYRNYFVTKCLATGAGQCNSMPAVYLALAEQLGAKAYLTFAPQHSFVKYPAGGMIKNYEPTSNWHITDRWYMDNMFISPEAIRSGIYLDTVSNRQIVAHCILDLAAGYLKKHGAGDGSFVRSCIKAAMREYPRKNHIDLYLVYGSLMARELNRLVKQHGIKDLQQLEKVPEAANLLVSLKQNDDMIKRLGFRELPQSMYEALMKEHEFKGQVQQMQKKDGKIKRDLFLISDK